METPVLTSVDYARLMQFISQKNHRVLLNKTQVNKILFYVYGTYLAETGTPLFTDDSPKAWVYGPVFPRAYKNVNVDEIIAKFPDDKVEAFKKSPKALTLAVDAVRTMHGKSALSLTRWSHQEGSPWYQTIYEYDRDGRLVKQNPWNTPIADNKIKAYFSNPSNRIYG